MQGLPDDIVIHALSFAEDASSLKAMFLCSRSHGLLRCSDYLRNKWLDARTPAQVVELLTASVTEERADQLDLLLVSNIRAKLTSVQIASALRLAIRLAMVMALPRLSFSRLTPFCQMSVNDFVWRERDHQENVTGFGRIEFKVNGLEEEPLMFSCIDSSRLSLVKTVVFTCHKRMYSTDIYPYMGTTNRVTTVHLGAPASAALVPVEALSILFDHNERIVVIRV